MQEKKDSEGSVMRRDIATLLQNKEIELARAKALKLTQQDILGDLLEMLGMHLGLLVEHFNELSEK